MSGARVANLGVLFASAFILGCGGAAGPSTSSGAETCQNSICPQGAGSYKFCTAPRASSCRYVGMDGTAYSCQSCSNCTAAAASINNWCAMQSGGGDCNSCSASAQGSSGACASQVSACTSDSACATLAQCLQNCAAADSTCQQNCNSAAPAASQSLLNAVLSCVCSTCSTQCASQCGGGGTTGSTGGNTGSTGGSTGGGTTGSSDPCGTCQDGVLGMGGSCTSALSTCQNDSACNTLIGCLNNCAQGDTNCENMCATTAGMTPVSEFNAIGDCICNNCTTECASVCGGSGGTTGGGTTGTTGGGTTGTTGGGTTGGGTTGGGTTGGGTTGGGTTGGGTTGGDPAQVCSTCEDSAFTGTCKTAVDTCNASPACVTTFNCTNGCTYGDTSCLSACVSGRSSTTINKLNAVIDCVCTTACMNECGSVLPACTP